MEAFAEILNAYFGTEFSAHDATIIQVLFKLVRMKANNQHVDNYDDIEGYTHIAALCARVR